MLARATGLYFCLTKYAFKVLFFKKRMRDCEILDYRELYRNDLTGKIPEELGYLKSLISMDLYDNKLEGKIPKSFGKLKSLKFL